MEMDFTTERPDKKQTYRNVKQHVTDAK